MKQIDGRFDVTFTTKDSLRLPPAYQMKYDIEERFAAVLDEYLNEKNIAGNEVHYVFCNDFNIDDYEE